MISFNDFLPAGEAGGKISIIFNKKIYDLKAYAVERLMRLKGLCGLKAYAV